MILVALCFRILDRLTDIFILTTQW